jgi:hypothetical protein
METVYTSFVMLGRRIEIIYSLIVPLVGESRGLLWQIVG